MIGLKSLFVAGIACIISFTSFAASNNSQLPSVKIQTAGSEAVVFESKSQGCDSNDIPDAALRAFRRNDGSVIAFAAHWTNLPFAVTNFQKFTRICNSSYLGSSSPVPADADDLGWLTALWKLRNSNVVVGIVHNEYQGNKHKGQCRYTSYAECWTNSLTMAVSNDEGGTFVLRRPNYIVAKGPATYDRAQGARYGYYNPSNIIYFRGYYYMAASAIDLGGIHKGTCFMRAKDVQNPADWKGWDGSSFTISLAASLSDDQGISCRSPSNLGGIMGSFLKIRGTDMVIAFSLRTDLSNLTKAAAITYTTSSNLVDWTIPQVLMELEPYWGTRCDKTVSYRYNYPSVVDFTSQSENFDDTGKNPFLFLSRASVTNCGVTMLRDLVKVPLAIQFPLLNPQGSGSQFQ